MLNAIDNKKINVMAHHEELKWMNQQYFNLTIK
jgi:hypothetical protein